jgi:elongation factor Ts
LNGGANIVNASYVHMNGKIGVIASMEVSENLVGNAEVVQVGKDLCMQAAAMRPSWLDRDSVPADRVASEKEILMTQTVNEGKPAHVAEKIVAGRINKFFQEMCLMEQDFIKDGSVSVKKYVDGVAKSLGGEIKPVAFIRYERGEGIAKKEDNFAAEVAGMVK